MAGRLFIIAVLMVVAVVGYTIVSRGPVLSGTTDDPQGTVRLGMAAVAVHDYDGVLALTCKQKQDTALEPLLGTSGLASLGNIGVNEREVAEAMAITYTNVSFQEVSRTETAATLKVRLTGTPTIDNVKMRAIMAKVLKNRQSKVTKADVDAAMKQMNLAPETFDATFILVKKGDGWLLC
jgi:hypothetical protein